MGGEDRPDLMALPSLPRPLRCCSHHYFKYCKISALALLKMVMHARSGGNLEVMGLMLGKVDGETMIIMDSFALPVEGTETRVNAQAAAYEYMAAYIENAKQVRRGGRGCLTHPWRSCASCELQEHTWALQASSLPQ